MKAPRLDITSVILCEEVRREITTKDILLGVFPGDIASQGFPAQIPVAFWFSFKPSASGNMEFELRLLDQTNAALIELKSEILVGDNLGPAAFFTPPLRLQVVKPSKFRLQMRQGGAGWKTIKTFGVEKIDPANPIIGFIKGHGVPSGASSSDADGA
jgi:hypothetical protein